MSLQFKFFILVTIMAIAHATSRILSKPGCQEFSHGVTFNDSQAIGTWYLMDHKLFSPQSQELRCIQFTLVTDQERKDLSNQLKHFVKGLKWERLTMKMHLPCDSAQSNKTRVYFVEKIQDNGSYRTLQKSALTVIPTEYHLYPMRLKLIEDQYLAMMDCNEKFVFLMSKEPQGQELSEHLKKLIKSYWPEIET